MPYWITPPSLLAAINITISRTATLLLLLACSASINADTLLKPYQAIYGTKLGGISAEMEQTLNKEAAGHWQLRSYASLLFASVEEQASFTEADNQLTPLSYRYNNKLSSKRNSELVFDPKQKTAVDRLHSKKPLTLPDNSYDKLSFQIQLQLDLLKDPEFSQRTYHLVERKKLKNYQVKLLGEETLNTALGKFSTIKLEQRRPGKDKYTLMWLAKDWNYFLLRVVRIDEGEQEYQIDLKQAELDGRKIQGQ
ncbi:DUF3108 domain-containing protein [Oceanicoccus sagamiensis]|uniref:DUF3108 domain-containing protein n=1 Tax=Oceanicoccus sagamiensis TaxID=716816 RepID=A0A1X9N962_9GAMM|nr:DUF3108 domain-containing protein [Oceanicoccus sagamiensis]ARN72972.1 hypothetical protein BST96_01930 [Oceanicoccus sagamiensis]